MTAFPIDYGLFVLFSLAALAGMTVWLRRQGWIDRTMILVWAATLALLCIGWLLVEDAGNKQRSHLRRQIEGFAPTYAYELEKANHAAIRLDTPPDDELYQRLIDKQIQWLKRNRAISDVYTFRKHPKGNQLIVDSETDYDRNNLYEGDREKRTDIGEVWEEKSPYLDRAYKGEATFDDSPYQDRWGTWVSAYVPMRDESGEIDAILGVDFPADQWVAQIARARRAMIGFLSVVVTVVLASTLIIAILRVNLAERRRSEMQIREVAEQTRRIIDTTYAAFVSIDHNGRIIDWNPQAEKTFGWSKQEAIGRLIHETIIPPDYRDAHRQGLARFMKSGEEKVLNQILELSALHKNGEQFPVELTITQIASDHNIAFFAFLHDISDRKAAEDELRRAKNEAEAATKAKSEFLANMSHEIRTPMNGIIGMSQLLAGTRLDAQQQDYLGMVRVSASSLLRLLNDILDFSKIEAGKLELEHVDFSLRDCVSQSAQTLGAKAAEKSIELACRIAPDLPDRLIGDPGRLGQIIVNLVGNAVKFTDEGEVVVDVRRAASEDDGPLALEFSVRDTGVGIPEDKCKKIFDVFSQADASTTRRFGGTGLGLAISTQLVELMGGRIWVASQVNEGSTFHFTAHFGVSAEGAEQAPVSISNLADLSVLVVDDNTTNRRIFEELLKSWNMTPAIASDGFSALAEMKRAAELGQPFQLVLLDCMMPEMDGFQFAEHVRADKALADCTLIMISSGANANDAKKCEQHGIARYMLKPVIQSELLATIAGVVDEHTTTASEARVSDPISDADESKSLDILLVEDGIVNQQVAIGMLQGHNVIVASDGRQAVRTMEDNRFDLVLMDLQMPEMDGFEATAAIRRQEGESNRRTPIIAMTASAMKGDRERCYEAGMDSYVAKPFSAEELHAAIAAFAIEEPRGAHTDNSAAPDVAGGSGIAGNGLEPIDGIDLQEARRRIPGGDEGIREIAGLLIEQSKQLLGELKQAIAENDAATIRRIAHTLKGSASIFAAEDVVEAASEMERFGEASEISEAGAAFPALEEHVQHLNLILSQLAH